MCLMAETARAAFSHWLEIVFSITPGSLVLTTENLSK